MQRATKTLHDFCQIFYRLGLDPGIGFHLDGTGNMIAFADQLLIHRLPLLKLLLVGLLVNVFMLARPLCAKRGAPGRGVGRSGIV